MALESKERVFGILPAPFFAQANHRNPRSLLSNPTETLATQVIIHGIEQRTLLELFKGLQTAYCEYQLSIKARRSFGNEVLALKLSSFSVVKAFCEI